MDKGKKKTGGKTGKKKVSPKKTEKSSKKKKTIKNKSTKEVNQNNNNNENNQNNAGGAEISVVEQKENADDIKNLEDKLNQPLSKKYLPPIQKNNNEIDNENEQQDIKEEEKIEEKVEVKQKVEMSIGTPHFYDVKGLKNVLEEKNKKINQENNEQEKYKLSLNNLLNDLNKILSENIELLYNDEEDENKKKKQEKINYLQNVLYTYQMQSKDTKEKNKSYKQHYEILLKRDENTQKESLIEYEALIEEKKNDNNILNKKIIELKTKSRKDNIELKAFSGNVKNQNINNLTNELKTLHIKKAEYFSKLNKNKKTLVICQKELNNLKEKYDENKKNNKYFNARIEEEINRLNDDLTGTEEEIYNKVENDKTFIQKKIAHQEKVNSLFKLSGDPKKLKLRKGNSLEPLARKAIRYDVRSGYNTRRMNIVAKNKNPIEIAYEKNKTKENVNSNKNILEEDDLSNINYNTLTDYEYRELLIKKEHYNDVTIKLEKSIKEAQKMYIRRIKEIKITLDDNSKKLSTRKQENELLKCEIADLNKILALTEEEAKINNNNYNNKNITNNTKMKNNNLDEKELESHKEYLSPEYYQTNKNKKEKDKTLIPTHSNNDLTGNEILNDLKGMNMEGAAQGVSLIDGQGGGRKLSNLGMKFPDLSNIEEDKGDKMINNNVEFNRSKAIDDIKKKYNIKKSNIEDNNINDIEIDDNELNFDEVNEEKLRKEQENIRKKEIEDRERLAKELEDEKKFFKEHENILKGKEERQFEPPIDNDVGIENNHLDIEDKKEIKD